MDPMFLVKSVLIPLVLASMVVSVAFLRSRSVGGARLVALSGPLAVGLAFVVGVPMVLGRVPQWKPAQASEWLPFLGIAAMVVGIIDAVLPRKVWSTVVTALMLAAFAWAVLAGPLDSAVTRLAGEPGGVALPWLMGALIVAPALAARAGARWTTNAGPVFAIGLLTACSIAAIVLSGTAMFGQFAALLGLALAPIGFAILVRRPWATDRGLMVTFVSLHATMWLMTHFYATKDGVWTATALFCLAPVGLLVARLPRLAKNPKVAGWIQIVVVVAMGAAGLATVVATTPKAQPGEQDGSDLYK